MALRRGVSPALTAAKPNPFESMQAETQAADTSGMKKPAPPMPPTMGGSGSKSHTPPGAKRRPPAFGKM